MKKFVISSVLVSSLTLAAIGLADSPPTETISMNYTEIEFTYATDNQGSGRDYTVAEDTPEAALLLPAVQAAREAARSSAQDNASPTDLAAESEQEVGLLLPAVQKAP